MNPTSISSELPLPGPAARAHSQRVIARVQRAIDARGDGWLPFDAYMDLVLYAPGLGYYSAGARKFGEDGDFITAPELSPLFGQAVARWTQSVASQLDVGEPWTVVEYGAGTGALARAMLDALVGTASPPSRYLIVELSGDLRERQRERLSGCALADRVQWLDGPPLSPVRGVVLANEVLDAFACARFRVRGEGARSGVEVLGVSGNGEAALSLAWRAADPDQVMAVEALERRLGRPFAAGYVSELCPRRDAWLASIAPSLEAGAMLLIDYGLSEQEYYAPARRDGTLLCYYRHRAHDDVLHLPGLQDLTAWVDFSAVARGAAALALDLTGYTTQAGFLLGNGIDALASAAMASAVSEAARLQVASACRQLLLPGSMGERFRVMALGRGLSEPLPGLAGPDLRRTLGRSSAR
ncbi:MAG: SAM-dependent methyltransferase [Pseudomonadota bacterium]